MLRQGHEKMLPDLALRKYFCQVLKRKKSYRPHFSSFLPNFQSMVAGEAGTLGQVALHLAVTMGLDLVPVRAIVRSHHPWVKIAWAHGERWRDAFTKRLACQSILLVTRLVRNHTLPGQRNAMKNQGKGFIANTWPRGIGWTVASMSTSRSLRGTSLIDGPAWLFINRSTRVWI